MERGGWPKVVFAAGAWLSPILYGTTILMWKGIGGVMAGGEPASEAVRDFATNYGFFIFFIPSTLSTAMYAGFCVFRSGQKLFRSYLMGAAMIAGIPATMGLLNEVLIYNKGYFLAVTLVLAIAMLVVFTVYYLSLLAIRKLVILQYQGELRAREKRAARRAEG